MKLLTFILLLFLIGCSHIKDKAHQARNTASIEAKRFQIWSSEYLETEAKGRRSSEATVSTDLSSFSFTQNGGIVGSLTVTFTTDSSGDAFAISGPGRYIIDLGTRNCAEAPVPI